MSDIEEKSDVICKKLLSSVKLERLNALKSAKQLFTPPANEAHHLIYEKIHLNIIRCYSDQNEICREHACEVISEALRTIKITEYYMDYVISAVFRRIGEKEILEPSEELRALFLHQLTFLIQKCQEEENVKLSIDSYNQIVNILLNCAKDPNASVQKEACLCIQNLASATSHFHYRAEAFVKPLVLMLHHKHYSNRISAIKSLEVICFHLNANIDCIKGIVSEVSQLLMDSIPLVRKECGRFSCQILLCLRDRYSLFNCLLPIVLICLADESDEVRTDITQLWIKCGEQYYQENEEDLKDLTLSINDDEKPFSNTQRPTLGCRSLIKRHSKYIQTTLKNILEWKTETKIQSLKLLSEIILHLEEDISKIFNEAFPIISKACADENKEVANQAVQVAVLFGAYLSDENLFNTSLEDIIKNPHIGYLKCLCGIYINFNQFSANNIKILIAILAENEITHKNNEDYYRSVIKLLDIITSKMYSSENCIQLKIESLTFEDKVNGMEQNLYTILITIMGFSYSQSYDEVYSNCDKIMNRIIMINKTSRKELDKQFLDSILISISDLDSEKGINSKPVMLLYGLICICGFQDQYLNSLRNCIKIIFQSPQNEKKVIIFSAIAKSMLTCDSESLTDSAAIKGFIEEIVVDHLTWKAGSNSESLRAMAVSTLCAMVQDSDNKLAHMILYESLKHFPQLINDNLYETRINSLKCFRNVAQMEIELLQPLVHAILQRLDDSVPEVRYLAANVLCKFELKDVENDYATNQWNILLGFIFSKLFTAFEGAEIKLKNILKQTMVTLGRKYSKVFFSTYNELPSTIKSREDIIEMKQIISD